MDLSLVQPELLLALLAFVVLGLDLLMGRGSNRAVLGWVTVAGLAWVLWFSVEQTLLGSLPGAVYRVDPYTHLFRALIPLTSIFVVLLSMQYVTKRLRHSGEYYGLVVIATLAMVLMAGAGELITAYIALETLNFCLYVLASYDKPDLRSNEAGVKYIVLSALASALLLYGISFLYGITGTTSYAAISSALAASDPAVAGGLAAALLLILAGLGFKLAAVPFHAWTPDVYEGAPTPVTALIAVGSKTAAFALVIRLFGEALGPAAVLWQPAMALLAVASMTYGNLVAMQQTNLKRLLAYSSISQVGYLLLALAVLSESTATAALIHLAGYAVTNLAAFACMIAYQNQTGKEDMEGFSGMAERAPLLAFGMAVALFSLAGMPLFAGFVTKFYLFIAVAQNGALWLGLVGIAVINSMISLYYYLKVLKAAYIAAPAEGGRLTIGPVLSLTVVALVLLVFAVGLYPYPLAAIVGAATDALRFRF
ncbi:MAG: NADH-quinone oxidoreductase subunit N [Dehalococcoidia bacterium]|nr:NADH-quinone oxidoreductase subunit N [Dehalococcoidia bacterium]